MDGAEPLIQDIGLRWIESFYYCRTFIYTKIRLFTIVIDFVSYLNRKVISPYRGQEYQIHTLMIQ